MTTTLEFSAIGLDFIAEVNATKFLPGRRTGGNHARSELRGCATNVRELVVKK